MSFHSAILSESVWWHKYPLEIFEYWNALMVFNGAINTAQWAQGNHFHMAWAYPHLQTSLFSKKTDRLWWQSLPTTCNFDSPLLERLLLAALSSGGPNGHLLVKTSASSLIFTHFKAHLKQWTQIYTIWSKEKHNRFISWKVSECYRVVPDDCEVKRQLV